MAVTNTDPDLDALAEHLRNHAALRAKAEIGLVSEVGRGSEFSFTIQLPMQVEPQRILLAVEKIRGALITINVKKKRSSGTTVST